MFYIIITALALALWAYIDPTAFKTFFTGWLWDGVKGVGKDINAKKAEIQAFQVERPERAGEIRAELNTYVDTETYNKNAGMRSVKAHRDLATARASNLGVKV